ncbi:MAG: YHS domain-containing (seleno)protein [Flavobacteriaceae bacterium]|tara:strand:+ start:46834 stop:47280 length:447 start_codon:yes stop_codon:yes gene_type:complete
MKHSIFIFLFCTTISFAQTIDYNTKKGFAANGYDVVAYFNNRAIEGDKKITTTLNDIIYKFSSEENLKAFNNNPKKYMPQYGGYCAYAVALKSSKVSINPETFLIENGKLYLFYDAWGTNTLKLWQKENEKLLIEKADKNWEQIKFKK